VVVVELRGMVVVLVVVDEMVELVERVVVYV